MKYNNMTKNVFQVKYSFDSIIINIKNKLNSVYIYMFWYKIIECNFNMKLLFFNIRIYTYMIICWISYFLFLDLLWIEYRRYPFYSLKLLLIITVFISIICLFDQRIFCLLSIILIDLFISIEFILYFIL